MQEQSDGHRHKAVAVGCGSRCCDCLYAVFHSCWCRERIVLLLLGLDNAGKSTLIATLRGEKAEKDVPTWGFDEKIWDTRKFRASVYDLGGGQSIRGIWPHYYAEAYGAIFVVDGADESRLWEAATELKAALKHPRLAGKPVLIVANKQNQSTALPFGALLSVLGPLNTSEQALIFCDCRLQLGDSRDEELLIGLDWLLATIKFRYYDLQERVAFESAKQRDEEERSLSERRERVKSFRAEKEAAAAGHPHPINLPCRDLESETHARMQAWIGPAESDPVTCSYECRTARGQSVKMSSADFDKSLQPLIQKYEESSDEPAYSPDEIADYFGDSSAKPSTAFADHVPNLPGQPLTTQRV